MKKVIFATLALAVGLWSCSSDDETTPIEKKQVDADGYVQMNIESSGNDSELRVMVGIGGSTCWDMGDVVKIIDVDGVPQTFSYAEATAKSNAKFTGKLKAGARVATYRAYHVPANANCQLKGGAVLGLERKDLIVAENGVINSSLYGSYCPMVALPVDFDAEIAKSTLLQFYHLNSMIEGRLTLREVDDAAIAALEVDSVEFYVEAKNGTPFYQNLDFKLGDLVNTKEVNLLDCFDFGSGSNKTGKISTIIKLKDTTIGKLIADSPMSYYAIPLFALPTQDSFDYTACLCFYKDGTKVVHFEGSSTSSGLNPAGLSPLNFDFQKKK